jgi:hypothetical protein
LPIVRALAGDSTMTKLFPPLLEAVFFAMTVLGSESGNLDRLGNLCYCIRSLAAAKRSPILRRSSNLGLLQTAWRDCNDNAGSSTRKSSFASAAIAFTSRGATIGLSGNNFAGSPIRIQPNHIACQAGFTAGSAHLVDRSTLRASNRRTSFLHSGIETLWQAH